MVDNSLAKLYRSVKRLVVYEPPKIAKPFVLGEKRYDGQDDQEPASSAALANEQQKLDNYLAQARRLADMMAEAKAALAASPVDSEALARVAKEMAVSARRQEELAPMLLAYTSRLDAADRRVSASLEENRKIIDSLYHSDINKDILIRDFSLPGNPGVPAMLVFLDGMIDKQIIDLAILQPLMLLSTIRQGKAGAELLATLAENYLPTNQASVVATYKDVMDGVNGGDTVLFIDGSNQALVLATKGYQQRGVERPQIEQSVRGAQAAFSEGLRTNTGLIRTILSSSDLVTEIIMIGDRAPKKCAVMYLKNLANPELVSEVKRRLGSIRTDYALNLGVVEQFIEDQPANPFPQSLSTERPDLTAAALLEGRVVLLYEGVPFAHVLPVSFFTFFHSIEDFTMSPVIANFTRLLRMTGALISVVLPSVYMALSYFHPEALPTELVLAIAGAREKVPFPTMFELAIMELAFEFIREAGLRIPGMLGSTIGIVGAIILGQAAVTANLVSPVMVVVVAFTGLASFTIPDYRMASTLRVIRFGFMLAAVSFGLVGVSFALLLTAAVLCGMKSFGVPYLAPVAPKTMSGLDVVIRGPVFRQENRSDALNTMDSSRQPEIARPWIMKKKSGGEGDGS